MIGMIDGTYTAYKYSILRNVLEQEGDRAVYNEKTFSGKFSELKSSDMPYKLEIGLTGLFSYILKGGIFKCTYNEKIIFELAYTMKGDQLYLTRDGTPLSDEEIGIVSFNGNLIYIEKNNDLYTLIRPGGEAEADADNKQPSIRSSVAVNDEKGTGITDQAESGGAQTSTGNDTVISQTGSPGPAERSAPRTGQPSVTVTTSSKGQPDEAATDAVSPDCRSEKDAPAAKDDVLPKDQSEEDVPRPIKEDVPPGDKAGAIRSDASIKLDKGTYVPYERMDVSVKSITETMFSEKAFVAIYRSGAPHTEFGAYQYPAAGDSMLVFSAPNELGKYEMRLYRKDRQYDETTFIMGITFRVA
ncbi:MAG: hypothetical protein LBE47_03350 [Methanomassiliicoccaceae archaeon]|jgi:hypothetical protein|nr:hypothetical protein [Methanomassiliicoccaceae archaeon]